MEAFRYVGVPNKLTSNQFLCLKRIKICSWIKCQSSFHIFSICSSNDNITRYVSVSQIQWKCNIIWIGKMVGFIQPQAAGHSITLSNNALWNGHWIPSHVHCMGCWITCLIPKVRQKENRIKHTKAFLICTFSMVTRNFAVWEQKSPLNCDC